jgi:hypothetical protein
LAREAHQAGHETTREQPMKVYFFLSVLCVFAVHTPQREG